MVPVDAAATLSFGDKPWIIVSTNARVAASSGSIGVCTFRNRVGWPVDREITKFPSTSPLKLTVDTVLPK